MLNCRISQCLVLIFHQKHSNLKREMWKEAKDRIQISQRDLRLN